MTEKRDLELDPLDLAVRARRGALAPTEQRVLEQALEASAALRVAHALGRDFDVVSRVRPGDEALVERAASQALERRTAARPRRFWRLAMVLAATLLLASAAAATRTYFAQRREAEPAERAPVAKLRTDVRKLAQSPALATTPPVEAALPPSPTGSSHQRSHGPEQLPHERASAAASTEATAAGLFRDASAARRAGAFSTARSLYVELQTRFPDSSEASVSRVSLGKLYLSAGQAREAEQEFGKYLRSGRGDLREEALVGRADALFALGRGLEEKDVWSELLGRHPASVYAARARQRVAAIDAARQATP